MYASFFIWIRCTPWLAALQTRYLMLIRDRNSRYALCHLKRSTNIQTIVIVVEALWIGSKVTFSSEMLTQYEMSCHFMC